MTALARVPVWAQLATLLGLSTILRFWAASRVQGPWIMPDEAIYAELGESLYREGRFEVLGRPADFLSLVYPALIGPFLAARDIEWGYHWVKLAQAFVMSLAALPVYLWARRLTSAGSAVAAAALTLAIPGLAYTGLLMTEVVFYPVTVLAAYAMASALERPTTAAQALLVAAVGLAVLTRLQLFVLVPVFVTALAAFLVLERRPRDVLRFAPALGGLGALCAAWAGWRLRDGGPLSRLFGGYQPAGDVAYGLGDVARFALYHAADLVLLAGIWPFCTLLLLWSCAATSRALRAYLAVASALCAWLVLEVGVFASGLVGHLAERNLLPLAPVLFVGFTAWVGLGGPRPRRPLVGACAAALVLLAATPLSDLVSSVWFHNTFALLPLIELEEAAPTLDLDLFVVIGAGIALLVLAWLPTAWLRALPLLLAVVFIETSAWAGNEVARFANGTQAKALGADPRWIDRRARGSTSYLFLGELTWPVVWQNAFWNHRIERVYGLLTARVVGGLPQLSVGPLEDGRLVLTNGRPAQGDYAVASYPVTFRGRSLSTAGEGLVLWKLDRPFRLSVWTQRVEGHVRVLVYACGRGVLHLRLEGPGPAEVELRRNDAPFRRVQLDDAGDWQGQIPADPPSPRGTRLCTFDVVGPPAVLAPQVVFVRGP